MMTWFCSDQLVQEHRDVLTQPGFLSPRSRFSVEFPYDQYVSSVTVCDTVLFSVRTWPSAVGFPDSLFCLSVTMCQEFGSLHQKPHWQTLHNFGMSIREDCWKVYTVYLFWHCSFQKSCWHCVHPLEWTYSNGFPILKYSKDFLCDPFPCLKAFREWPLLWLLRISWNIKFVKSLSRPFLRGKTVFWFLFDKFHLVMFLKLPLASSQWLKLRNMLQVMPLMYHQLHLGAWDSSRQLQLASEIIRASALYMLLKYASICYNCTSRIFKISQQSSACTT